MSAVKTFGYDRQSKVPAIAGTAAKVCRSCKRWFAARPREQRCDDCLPANLKRRRTAKAHYAELETSGALRGSQRRSEGFEPTHTTTPKRPVGAQAPQVRDLNGDQGTLCRDLARELAEKIDYPKGRPQPMSRALKHAITLRNVNHGKQGRNDLERFS